MNVKIVSRETSVSVGSRGWGYVPSVGRGKGVGGVLEGTVP